MQRRCLGREDIDLGRTELPLRVVLCPSTRTRPPTPPRRASALL